MSTVQSPGESPRHPDDYYVLRVPVDLDAIDTFRIAASLLMCSVSELVGGAAMAFAEGLIELAQNGPAEEMETLLKSWREIHHAS